MCLITVENRKKAAEDIICYKVLRPQNGGLVSPAQYRCGNVLYWTVGETKKDNAKGRKHDDIVEGGYFHSFKNIQDAMDYKEFCCPIYQIFKATIPKGTWYYEGNNSTFKRAPGYASKSLRIDKYEP